MKKGKTLSAWFRQNPAGALPRPRFTEPYFESYTKSVGSLLLAWNDLHERLATLFVMAMGLESFAKSFAVWHKVRNDSGKRQILRAALDNLGAKSIGTRTKLVPEIIWILDSADKLEGGRDDSAHTPVHFGYTNPFTLTEIIARHGEGLGDKAVMPMVGFGNPRAQRLIQSNRNLLSEQACSNQNSYSSRLRDGN